MQIAEELDVIVRAHRWRQMIESGEHSSSAELARAEKIDESYVGRVLRLTLISPEITEALEPSGNPVVDCSGCERPTASRERSAAPDSGASRSTAQHGADGS